MPGEYRYHRPGVRLEYYSHPYDYFEQHAANQPTEQPSMDRHFFPVDQHEALQFAADEPDLRGFAVNSPTGSTLGSIVGFLADAGNAVVPYAYVRTDDGRTVVVPTNQFLVFPDLQLVTLEGGKDALRGAPDAQRNDEDAVRADRYWSDYRRQNAA